MTRFDIFYSRFTQSYPYPRYLRSYTISTSMDALVFRDGKQLIDFSSSDYLGLAKHPHLRACSQEFAARWGTGSGSSRLVRGNLAIYDQLEAELAGQLGKESALILGCGFQANATILEALLDPAVFKEEPLVFCDKAIHASLYAGLVRLKKFHRFHHNRLDHLKMLLEQYKTSTQPKFIIAESIYSMEGDQADLAQLVQVAEHYQAALYVDDAHAVGIYGPLGWGKAAEWSGKIDLIMGTFSKALGSFGAYVGCSQVLRQYLIHRCKGLIYSTASSPLILGAMSAAIELLPRLQKERERVLYFAEQTRSFFEKTGLCYGAANTHIIPWIIGSAEKTRLAAQLLEEHGILAVAIQYPTVAAHKNRIRFCISALHRETDLELLFSSIQKVKKKLKI